MAIQSFASREVEEFFITEVIPRRVGWSGVATVAKRKLDMLDYADRLGDLRSPPGNRLEALKHRLAVARRFPMDRCRAGGSRHR